MTKQLSFEVLPASGEYRLNPQYCTKGKYVCSVELLVKVPSPYESVEPLKLDSYHWGILEVKAEAFLKRDRNVKALRERLWKRFREKLGFSPENRG